MNMQILMKDIYPNADYIQKTGRKPARVIDFDSINFATYMHFNAQIIALNFLRIYIAYLIDIKILS